MARLFETGLDVFGTRGVALFGDGGAVTGRIDVATATIGQVHIETAKPAGAVRVEGGDRKTTTSLSAGDIAIIGANSDNPDEFAFVALVDIAAGTEITFTDSGVLAAGGFRASEGAVKWTAAANISAGTIVNSITDAAQFASANDANVGNNGFALSTSGDQIIAFTGSSAAPVFLYQLMLNSTEFQSDATSSNTSALAPGLVAGVSAVAVGQGSGETDETDNSVYNMSLISGTQADILAAIGDIANWNGSGSPLTMPTGSFTVNAGVDTTAPVISSTTPADDGAVSVESANLVIEFNENISAGSGNIVIRNSDGTAFETIAITAPGVTISGRELTINPSSDFVFGNSYYVEIDAGAVEDAAGNAFAGLSGATGFNFDVRSLRIGDVQGDVIDNFTVGTTDRSAFEGQTVTLTGVVVGDYQDGSGADGDLDGFYIQDPTGDGNAATSDGIFIYTGPGSSLDVTRGDTVTVTGTVEEFFGQTQIDVQSGSVSIDSSGFDISTLMTTVDLSTTSWAIDDDGDFIIDLEAYEGMLVDFAGSILTVTETRNLDDFSEFRVSGAGRSEQFSQFASDLNSTAYEAYLQSVASTNFLIDDGLNGTGTSPLIWPDGSFDPSDVFRLGSTFTDVFGVMGYGFDNFRLRAIDQDDDGQLGDEFTFDPAGNPRPTGPVGEAGALKVASVNVENFFITLGERGASTQAEYDRQLEKIVTGLQEIDADILGLVEIENNFANGGSLKALVDALNAEAGAGTWDYVDPGVNQIGTDQIAQGFIYKTATVGLAQGTSLAILDDSDLAGLGITDLGDRGAVFDGVSTSRNPIAATFTELATGHSFTATVNHFKSKGSGGATGANRDQNDGQAAYNEVRTISSEALAAWLATNPTGAMDADYMILGDLNSYAAEDPITALEAAGYTDLADIYSALGASSFVFDGMTGTLDYTLANGALLSQTVGFDIWNGNADEPEALEYFQDLIDDFPGLFDASNPWRFSDHDVVVASLNLGLQQGDGGNNTLTGTAFVDEIFGFGGDDVITGGASDDRITAGGGADDVSGGDGNDVIQGNGGNDTINAGAGDDIISAGSGNDVVFGGDGNDSITGAGGVDRLFGDDGNDTISAQNGNDVVVGGAGDDVLNGGEGRDVLIGGTGADELRGSDGDDRLVADAGDDTIVGGSGNDDIFGGEGNDTATGGSGRDTMFGNDGNDTLSGDGFADTLYGGDGNDILNGGNGNDLIFGQNDADTIFGGDGFDRILGGDGMDTINGDGGNDTITAGTGDDVVRGGFGNDLILGEAGNDTLRGNGNDDYLIGGTGNDDLFGGTGADRIRFGLGDGTDTFHDFTDNEDEILLDDDLWTGSLTAADVVATFATLSGTTATFTFGADVLVVENVTNLNDLVDDLVIV